MCEGFHNRFNRFLRKRKPNLWVFLKKINVENTHNEIKISKIKKGNFIDKAKTSKFIHFENTLSKKYKDLEDGVIGIKQFIQSIALLQRR